MKSAKFSAWTIVLVLIGGLLMADPARALRVNVSPQGDADKLVFSFDSGALPPFNVTRVGAEQLLVSLPAATWDVEPKPTNKSDAGKLIQSIAATDRGVLLTTKTNGFGFIRVPVPGKPQFVLQVFRDPIGARWKPKAAPQAPAAPASAEVGERVAPPPEVRQQQAAPQPVPTAQNQAVSQTSVPVQAPAEQQPTQAVPSSQGERKPFFAVPYSVRNEVTPPDQPAEPQPTASATESGDYPAANSLKFRVVNKTADQVKFAELAGSDAASPSVSQPVAQPQPVTPPQPVTSLQPVTQPQPVAQLQPVSQPQAVTPPPVTQESQSQTVTQPVAVTPPPAATVTQETAPMPVMQQAVSAPPQPEQAPTAVADSPVLSQTEEVSGQGSAGGTVAPPPGSSVAQQPQAVVPSQGVAQPVQQGGVIGQVQPVEPTVSGQGQVGGAVAPPPMVVQGAPPPEATAEEVAQAEKSLEPAPEAAVAPESEEFQAPTLEDVPLEEDAPQTEEETLDPNSFAAQEKMVRDKLYEAQNLMFNGSLEQALPIYEFILKQPRVPDDVHEETMYAVADIKKQLHTDDLEDFYDEITQSYIEAMNANLRSNRVPRALLNLGLINLRVGNFPEARAYFKILQEKYPDDDNIPSISYYWGEYYYRKGDYKKAADQFQYLIQTYPEHELVKDAAFQLADSLNKTGFLRQAYQIVDYIDKRWPDYYMENPEYLRLAGGVEMQLNMWPQAKDHYYTFYNLNPEADGADEVLARIGDIYVRQKERDAAKMVYEKVVKDFVDTEGALVAKMRLAEEGIYDDPSMGQMVDVFDRPYNKRPEKVYQEIVKRHPDSPLAPIAQIKLAMWYAFNKKYPEALAAAQDFIDAYPDNPLVERARSLGDSIFTLAVPGMVAEERYGRVVRYWENYDFIGKKDTKVDDRIKLNVATSYWKVGQPAKALELIEPYLKKRQIKDISDEALGLAVNIYLDDLAWSKIDDLVAMATENWTIKEAQKRQLDYARAMALQNMGKANQALAMWAELGKDVKVDPAFRAYAMYYMAKGALERQDLRRVFVYAQEALGLLLQTNGDPEKIKETVLMSIYATERSGRYEEALKWARQYDQYVDVDNPEWASTRFKLARIYRKAGAMDEWRQLLSDIIEKKPDSLQAQLAKSALATQELEDQVKEYSPAP